MSTRTDALSPAASPASALLERPGARALLAALGDGGHETRIVGGAVRDALLGRTVEDIDIATTRLPSDVIAIAGAKGWRAVPTGIAHGTVTVIVDGRPHEVTTLRRDVSTDGRHAVVAFTRDFREDALRRDFTMNALSLSADGAVHDYAQGVADALAGRVRFMGDPETRIREDYLRILRFFRFQASHGRGAPEPEGLAACVTLKDGLVRLSRERIRQELLKLLGTDGAPAAAAAMDSIGLWPLALPPGGFDTKVLARMVALEAAIGAPPDAVLRLAASAGAEPQALQAGLALSNAEAERIAAARAALPFDPSAAPDDVALRRALYLAGAGPLRDAVLLAAAREGRPASETATLLGRIEALSPGLPANPFRSADVLALGVAPGPGMGRVLKAATAAWLEAGLPEEAARQRAILEAALAAAAG
jgi:poly(A) polymerase